MKKPVEYFGRKFLACTISTAVDVLIYLVTVFVNPSAITSAVTIAFGSFVITIWFAYIGGNVWSSWVTSKYFRSELVGK